MTSGSKPITLEHYKVENLNRGVADVKHQLDLGVEGAKVALKRGKLNWGKGPGEKTIVLISLVQWGEGEASSSACIPQLVFKLGEKGICHQGSYRDAHGGAINLEITLVVKRDNMVFMAPLNKVDEERHIWAPGGRHSRTEVLAEETEGITACNGGIEALDVKGDKRGTRGQGR